MTWALAWLRHMKVVYAEIKKKPRRWGVSFYLKFRKVDVPQLEGAKKAKFLITRPDFSIPPFEVEAWLHLETQSTISFELLKIHSLAVGDAFKDVKTVAVLAVEVLQKKEAGPTTAATLTAEAVQKKENDDGDTSETSPVDKQHEPGYKTAYRQDDERAAMRHFISMGSRRPAARLALECGAVEELLKRKESGPVAFCDLYCLKVRSDCSPYFQAQLAVEALSAEPVEVRAAGFDEVLSLANALPAPLAERLIREAVEKLALPDADVAYTDEHVSRAKAVIRNALASCITCVVDAREFFSKFVRGVYEIRDRRGHVKKYEIVLSTDDEVTVSRVAFRRGKRIRVPREFNDMLQRKLGVVIDDQYAEDLLRLLEEAVLPKP